MQVSSYVNHVHKKVSSAGQPEHWAPANSIAFFKADLDPANGDKSAALKFEQTFPDAPKVTDPADLKDALLAAAFAKDTGQSDQNVNYATDIKPWLGASAAVAVFVDAQQQTQSVGIIQVTDPAKAKAGMAKLDEPDPVAVPPATQLRATTSSSATAKPSSTRRLRVRRSQTSTPTPPTPPTSRR